MSSLPKKGDHGSRTDAWGIDRGYEDAFQKWHEASRQTIEAVRHAMGVDAGDNPQTEDHPVIVVQKGKSPHLSQTGSLGTSASIVLETGETLKVDRHLPADLPSGYHTLHSDGASKPTPLIVSPGKCYLPENLKTWGWSVQLYSARSRQSWGIGDFADLDRLAQWSAAEHKAGMLLLNPLSAPTPVTPQQPSPYYPSSRRFLNPLWINVEWVPGANTETVPQLETLAAAGRALNRHRLIDRDKVFGLKMRALELLWPYSSGNDSFHAFCRQGGSDLDRFATFCAIAETHGSGRHSWPEKYQQPTNPEVVGFARDNRRRVDFHKWLQWLLDTQLARCSRHLALMQDLPIGVDSDGADAWAWQDVLATGAAVGAPPDEFNTKGQDWGLPPFIPHKLRRAGYQPFIQTIRAAFRHGGGLRIDHVMGLFRLFWIPQGLSAAQGTYVRYDADELLSIVALESERARAYVVGEDLGTVEDSAREKLAAYHVMSYRLLWFEKELPDTYPLEALAAVTTHDLPTVAGLWSGADLQMQKDLHLNPNEESTAEIHHRLSRCADLPDGCPIEDVIDRSYRLLATAPSRILTAALDDAAAVEERPNVPATMSDKRPNWSIALPLPIEDLMRAPLPSRIASALQRTGDVPSTAHRPPR